MASFGGNTFDERGGGGGQSFPVHGGRAEFDVRTFPGGGASLYRITREAPDAITVPAQGTRSQIGALVGEVGNDGTLIYAGGTVYGFLSEVSGVEQVIDGLDLWRASLSLLVDWTAGGAVFPAFGIITESGLTLVTEAGQTLVTEDQQ